MGKQEHTGGKKPKSQMQRKPYDINLDEGFTAINLNKASGKQNNHKKRREKKKKKREMLHMCTYTLIHTYMHCCRSVVGYSEGIRRSGWGGGGGEPT